MAITLNNKPGLFGNMLAGLPSAVQFVPSEAGSSVSDKPIRFDIIDKHTGAVVGSAKTRARANQSRDKRDNAYGAYRYSVKTIYA